MLPDDVAVCCNSIRVSVCSPWFGFLRWRFCAIRFSSEWKMWSIMEVRCCYHRIRREAADRVVWSVSWCALMVVTICLAWWSPQGGFWLVWLSSAVFDGDGSPSKEVLCDQQCSMEWNGPCEDGMVGLLRDVPWVVCSVWIGIGWRNNGMKTMVMQRDGYVFDTWDDLVKMNMEMVLEWWWILSSCLISGDMVRPFGWLLPP